MKKNNEFFLQGPLLSNIIKYTIPIILTGILQLMFNAADLMVVGMKDSIYVGAVGSTGSTTHLVITLFMGLSIGAGVGVAHGLGSGQDQEVHRTVHTALPTAMISGIVLTVVGIFVSEPLLELMGTPEDVLPLSKKYMQIYFGGITFNLVYNYCGSILRAAGDTRSPLIYLIFAGTANVVLNMFFVLVLDWNVAGVAIATTLSQGISAVLCVINLMRRQDACHLNLKKLHIYKPQLLKMIRIGLPAGIQSGMFSLSNVIIQSSINSFGPMFMSGNAAAANIEGFMWVPANAFQQSCINFVGQNTGAGQHKRARQSVWVCLSCMMVVGFALGMLFYALGPQLLGLYISDSQQAMDYGMIRIEIIFPLYFLFGMMECTTGALRGRGSSLAPMIISVVGICGIRLAWIFTVFQMPAYHTPQSLYWSFPISWAVTFSSLLTVYLIISLRHKKQRPENALAH